MDGGQSMMDAHVVDVAMEATQSPCASCPDACYKNVCAKRLFASSKTYDGVMIQSTLHADDECAAMAKAASLTGSWRAWISDLSGSSPATRFTPAFQGPYVLAKLTTIRVVKSASAFAMALEHAIDHDENGMLVGGFAWTQTDPFGNAIFSSVTTGNACLDWKSSMQLQDKAVVGQIGGSWTFATTRACDQLSRIYCFEQ